MHCIALHCIATYPSFKCHVILTNTNPASSRIRGRIDEVFCKEGSKFPSAHIPHCTSLIACPRGYFHESGHATETENCAACTPCMTDGLKDKQCKYLGQTKCYDGSKTVKGDFDGDGTLSQREILRLLYMATEGYLWKDQFLSWGDMNHEDSCTLPGINCKEGLVTKIDLREAGLCAREHHREPCGQIPSEIGLLHDSLEVLDLSTNNVNKISLEIPKEIGSLTKLKILNLSKNIIGRLPPEIGLLSKLSILNLFQSDLTGTLEPAVWTLQNLENLDIRENLFIDQTIPTEIGLLTNLLVFKNSRSGFEGSIPSEIGLLTKMRNLYVELTRFSFLSCLLY